MGYGVKIFHPSPPHYVTRSPGDDEHPRLFQIGVPPLNKSVKAGEISSSEDLF